MKAAVDNNAFVDDAKELRNFTGGHGCETLSVVGVMLAKFQIAVARLPIHIPFSFDLV